MQSLFVANWKMHFSTRDCTEYLAGFLTTFKPHGKDTVLAPPYTLLAFMDDFLHRGIPALKGVELGAQNVHWQEAGAHTGEVAAPMLKELGVSYAIVGHSERRQFYGESSHFVARRASHAITHGIQPIVCVGEHSLEKGEGAGSFVIEQLRASVIGINDADAGKLVIAYEPVWAIGTGKAATPEIVAEIHSLIRRELIELFPNNGKSVPILYGGSTSPENIGALMACDEVNGALVGSSSLKPDVFSRLIENGRASKR